MTGLFRRLVGFGPPAVSREAALQIARRYCAEHDYPWQEPVVITQQLRSYRIVTHAEHRGGNVYLRIHSGSGQVISASFARR